MRTAPSGSPDRPCADRPRRLADQLADMIPGAASIRVSLADPTQPPPQPHALANDAAGQPIELSRTTAKIAARWILRVWPEADCCRAHIFHLATATLAPSNLDQAERSR